jgi:WD40 repeat protein
MSKRRVLQLTLLWVLAASSQPSWVTPPSPSPAVGGVEVIIGTGHSGVITALAVSPDGRYALSVSPDGVVKQWNVAGKQEMWSFRVPGPAYHMQWRPVASFNADGTRIVLQDQTESAQIIDTVSGQLIRQRLIGTMLNSHVTPRSPTARKLAAAGNASGRSAAPQVDNRSNQAGELADVFTDALIATMPDADLQPLLLSEDGKILVARAAHGFSGFQVWDLTEQRMTGQLRVFSYAQLALSPDGRLLAVNADDGLALYDLGRGASVTKLTSDAAAQEPECSSEFTPCALAFSPDGSVLARAESHFAPPNPVSLVRLWHVPDGAFLASLNASAVAFTPDGRLLLGLPTGGAPVLHELVTGRETPLAAGTGRMVEVSLISGGPLAVTADYAAGAKVWDLARGQLIGSIPCPDSDVAGTVTGSPREPLIAVGCRDGAVLLADMARLAAPRLLESGSNGGDNRHDDEQTNSSSVRWEGGPTCIRFSGDGSRLVKVTNSELTVWDVATRSTLQHIMLPPQRADAELRVRKEMPGLPSMAGANEKETNRPSAVYALAVRSDGALAAVGRTTDVLIWELSSGRLAKRLELPRSALTPWEALDISREGASGLAFSADGSRLLAVGSYGPRLWDVASGAPIKWPTTQPEVRMTSVERCRTKQCVQEAVKSQEQQALDFMESPITTGAAAFSPDGRLGALARGNRVSLLDLTTGNEIARLAGHTDPVRGLQFLPGGRRLLSVGDDGVLRVWSVTEGRELVALRAVGADDYVAVTPDQYYRLSHNGLHSVAFRHNDVVFPFEQFDLLFNRPDVIMERLGIAPHPLVEAYRHAYQKRLHKMGIDERSLGEELHVPQVEILTREVPPTTQASSLRLHVRAFDDAVALDRINLYVNDVPIYGSAGLAIPGEVRSVERELDVPLVSGYNKVQVSVLNRRGAESLRQTLYTDSTADPGPREAWVVAIGVSHYRNPRYALRFAAKDAHDLAAMFRTLGERGGQHRTAHVLEITDQAATRTAIRAAKEWLRQARRQDLAVVFAAGHGLVDDHQNYFYGTWDVDATNPGAAGLPFEDFEDLLDGIAPLEKLLLVDTCFSGEIDKDEVQTLTKVEGGARVTVRAHAAARNLVSLESSAPSSSSAEPDAALELQRDLFADLRRGTGAVVISSSSGNEYSLEGSQWGNGVFTYAVLQALGHARANSDGDSTVTVSKLQRYVTDEVRRLTDGAQNPTVRRENLDYDFVVD